MAEVIDILSVLSKTKEKEEPKNEVSFNNLTSANT